MASRHYFASASPVDPTDDELLTVAELCALLKVSRATFYRRLSAGLLYPLRPISLVGHPRFRRGDYRAAVRGCHAPNVRRIA